MNKKIKGILLSVILGVAVLSSTGCERESDVASYNISQQADNFNVYRKIIVYNNITDKVIQEFEGWASIEVDETESQLEVIYRIGDGEYAKDFIGLNSVTNYLVTQLDGSKVDIYHYQWLYHSEGDLIPVEITDGDK